MSAVSGSSHLYFVVIYTFVPDKEHIHNVYLQFVITCDVFQKLRGTYVT